jgi:hypothetical protein
VLRRSPAFSAALAVALFMAARPATVLASGIVNASATYQLTNKNPAGTAPVSKIVANVIPPGAIVPTTPSSSPLTIMTGSAGFDQSNLKVLLGSGKTPAGDPLQALALDFGTAGLQPGGILNFSLTLDPSLQAAPALQLPTDGTANGLSIVQTAAEVSATGGTGLGGGEPNNNAVPEPVSLVLWSSGAMALALAHVRRYRRSRPRMD